MLSEDILGRSIRCGWLHLPIIGRLVAKVATYDQLVTNNHVLCNRKCIAVQTSRFNYSRIYTPPTYGQKVSMAVQHGLTVKDKLPP